MRARLAVSQSPWLVKIGARSWKASTEPVGRRLARLAVPRNVWLMACWMRFLSTSGSPLSAASNASSSSMRISSSDDI